MFNSTPLHLAAKEGHIHIVGFLINHGADINAQKKGFFSVTPLHVSSQEGHVLVVKTLIEHGADVNKKDSLLYFILILKPLFIVHPNIIMLMLLNFFLKVELILTLRIKKGKLLWIMQVVK